MNIFGKKAPSTSKTTNGFIKFNNGYMRKATLTEYPSGLKIVEWANTFFEVEGCLDNCGYVYELCSNPDGATQFKS
jgi:hypothetical protein